MRLDDGLKEFIFGRQQESVAAQEHVERGLECGILCTDLRELAPYQIGNLERRAIWRKTHIHEDVAHRGRRNRRFIRKSALDGPDGEPRPDLGTGHQPLEFRLPRSQDVEEEYPLVERVDTTLSRPSVLSDAFRP